MVPRKEPIQNMGWSRPERIKELDLDLLRMGSVKTHLSGILRRATSRPVAIGARGAPTHLIISVEHARVISRKLATLSEDDPDFEFLAVREKLKKCIEEVEIDDDEN